MTFFFVSEIALSAASIVPMRVDVLQKVTTIPFASTPPPLIFAGISTDDSLCNAIHHFLAVVEILDDDTEALFVVVGFRLDRCISFKHS